MGTGGLLNIHPRDLKFPFELGKQSSCSMQLTNKTDKYVAFKVKTTNPKKYCVRPNMAVILPGDTCNVTVTMQAQKEVPPDMQTKDKFLIQSVPAPYGATTKDIKPDIFNMEDGRALEEFKLLVIYIPANPPSPVPEEPEEGYSPTASAIENGKKSANLFDAVTTSFEISKKKSSEAWTIISKLTEEKAAALQQNQRLHQELDLLRREVSKNRSNTSLLFTAFIGLLGIVTGYLMKNT
ncbi:hypothetical protein CRG98_007821 [Punica granatum]|uniref:MSP domain-containing protein n=1 Tax=Punica granatum TaxID=22663 RepID=A0A2I0KTK1_PUNGR|nr:hypothetical protein CRG98_007821 [Punica granatum]